MNEWSSILAPPSWAQQPWHTATTISCHHNHRTLPSLHLPTSHPIEPSRSQTQNAQMYECQMWCQCLDPPFQSPPPCTHHPGRTNPPVAHPLCPSFAQCTATTTMAPPSNWYPTTDYKSIPDLTLRTPPCSTLPCPPETWPVHPWLVMVAWDQSVNKSAIQMPTECWTGDIWILLYIF